MEGKPYNHPRDDLESLAYTFMFLVKPEKVPWTADSEVSVIIKKKKAFLSTQT
jgi:hypothetical protein